MLDPMSEITPASVKNTAVRRPPLRLIAEPDRQHSQQCPTESKCQQDHAGQDIFFSLDEGSGDQNEGHNKTSRQ